MAFDIEMIKAVYDRMAERIDAARAVVKKPLTLTEKILYSQPCGHILPLLIW